METKLALYLSEVNSASSYRALSMFVLIFPRLALPFVQDRKWKKKALLSEPKASFKAFTFFDLHNWEPEGRLMGFRKARFAPSISKLPASSAVDGTVAVAFFGLPFLAKQKR